MGLQNVGQSRIGFIDWFKKIGDSVGFDDTTGSPDTNDGGKREVPFFVLGSFGDDLRDNEGRGVFHS